MIDEKLRAFLVADGVLGYVGTRDSDNKPHGHRVWGWRVEGERTIALFVPKRFAGRIEEAAAAGEPLAFTPSSALTFETYQLKGKLVGAGPCDDADRAESAAHLERLRPMWNAFRVPDEVAAAFTTPVDIVVRFEVSEIFDQTPGPKAGAALGGGA
jgi:hypothetical protein